MSPTTFVFIFCMELEGRGACTNLFIAIKYFINFHMIRIYHELTGISTKTYATVLLYGNIQLTLAYPVMVQSRVF